YPLQNREFGTVVVSQFVNYLYLHRALKDVGCSYCLENFFLPSRVAYPPFNYFYLVTWDSKSIIECTVAVCDGSCSYDAIRIRDHGSFASFLGFDCRDYILDDYRYVGVRLKALAAYMNRAPRKLKPWVDIDRSCLVSKT